MFECLGRLTTARPRLVCALWLALGLGLTAVAPRWDARAVDDDIGFLPPRCPSVRGHALLAEAFPQEVFASRLVLAVERDDRPLDAADFALVDRCAAALDRLRADEPTLPLGRVVSHRDPFLGRRLVSGDGHATLLQVSLNTPFLAAQTRAAVDRAEAVVRAVAAEAGATAPALYVTGPAGVGRDLTRAGGTGLDATTGATVVLVVVVLLCVYRAPLLALIPLGTIAVSVWVALKGLALLTLIPGVYLVNVSQVFAVVLLYGAGTDYCLFLISRYREELTRGGDVAAAVRGSVGRVGGALAASAGTVVLGLGTLAFAEFAKLRCAGPAIALALVVALAASLTLAPALLCLVGPRAFWPGRIPRAADADRPTAWDALARLVVARPGLVLAVAAAALAPLAILGLHLRPDYRPTGELSSRCDSVRGLAVIQRRFSAGETGPVTVLLTAPRDWTSAEGRALLDRAGRALARLDAVHEVRGLTRPLGVPLPEMTQTKTRGLLASFASAARESADRPARAFYCAAVPGVDGATTSVTRLDIVLRTDPFSPESVAALSVVEAYLREQLPRTASAFGAVGWEVQGATANARDLAQVTEADRGRVNFLVLGGTFALLLVVVRRLWLAAYLLATVLLSYLATLGATSLLGLVTHGHLLTAVDWRVPFFLFTILVAVGEDYNILLVTRALEERKRLGSDRGMRRALARTGGTISSCGLIMAGTFGTLMLADLGTLVQTGFALAFGVLLDTFVVRPFLVPALMTLVWRAEDGTMSEPRAVRISRHGIEPIRKSAV